MSNGGQLNGRIMVKQFAKALEQVTKWIHEEEDEERKSCLIFQGKLNLLGLVALCGSREGHSQTELGLLIDSYLAAWMVPALDNMVSFMDGEDKARAEIMVKELKQSFLTFSDIDISDTHSSAERGV